MKSILSLSRTVAMGSLFAGAVLFASCNKDNDGDNNQDVPVAGVMAFNLATDVSSASVTLSGNVLTNQLAFGTYTGQYLAIVPGTRPVQSSNSNTGSSLASSDFNFETNKYYSLFVVGANNTYKNLVVHDDIDSLSSTGQAFVRYINAIPDSSKPTVTVTAAGNNVFNDNPSFTAVSEFKTIDPGSVTITVNNGSTINVNRTITLEQRKVYTVLLQGSPTGTGDNAVQIKFILNGTINENAGRAASSSAARAAN